MPTGRSVRYWLLVGLVALWLLLLVWPAVGARLGWTWSALVSLFFTPLCHQIPGRSFHLWGHQLAVCHRCTGIYFGFWLGLLALPFWRAACRLLLAKPRLMALFLAPMLINVVFPSTAWDRFATGFVFAFPFSVHVWNALEKMSLRTGLGRNTI